MQVMCKKCYQYYDEKLEECPNCGATGKDIPSVIFPSPNQATSKTAQDVFCVNCGTKIVAGNKFCPKCGRQVETNIEREGSSQIKKYSNIVMESLSKSKDMNGLIRIIAIASSILFLITQFLGMTYKLSSNYFGTSELYSGNAVLTMWEIATGASSLSSISGSIPSKYMLMVWIITLASLLCFLINGYFIVMLIKIYIQKEHISNIIDAIKGVSLTSSILFGCVVILGRWFSSKLESATSFSLGIGGLTYISLILAIILAVSSRMIVLAELDKEDRH